MSSLAAALLCLGRPAPAPDVGQPVDPPGTYGMSKTIMNDGGNSGHRRLGLADGRLM